MRAEQVRTRLEHARANVSDLQRAIDRSTDVFGLEVDATWPPDAPSYARSVIDSGAVSSFCVTAPNQLAALLRRPPTDTG